MRSRLSDTPILKTVSSNVEAVYYNRVRLALARLEKPLRIELINLRGLDIVLDDDIWVCVDRTLNDLPIFAWTGFQHSSRRNLLEPVSCKLRFYHNHADLICGTVLDLIHRNLENRLSNLDNQYQPATVTYLRSRQKQRL